MVATTRSVEATPETVVAKLAPAPLQVTVPEYFGTSDGVMPDARLARATPPAPTVEMSVHVELAAVPVLSREDKSAQVKAPDNSRSRLEGRGLRAQQNLDKLRRNFDPALMQKDLNFSAAVGRRLLPAQRVVDRLPSLGSCNPVAAIDRPKLPVCSRRRER